MMDMILSGMLGGLVNQATTRGLGLLEDVFDPWSGRNVTKKNFGLQEENLAYQKMLQQTMFNREDNSVQRKIADLKASGLNPMFAMGQGANAGQEIRTATPQIDRSSMDNAETRRLAESQMMLNMMQMKADIEKTQAETDAVRSGIMRDDNNFGLAVEQYLLSVDQHELAKDYYKLQEKRDEVARISSDVRDKNIQADTAIKELEKIGIPFKVAQAYIDSEMTLYDFMYAIRHGIRTVDRPGDIRSGVMSTYDNLRDFSGRHGTQYANIVQNTMRDIQTQRIGGR